MIHDIQPMKYHVEYEDLKPQPEDTVFLFDGSGVFCRTAEGETVYPKFSDLEALLPSGEAGRACFRYLFSIDNARFYIPDLAGGVAIPAPPGFERQEEGVFRTAKPRHLAFAGVTAHQLYLWYASRQFCGGCGVRMAHAPTERAMICPQCGRVEYPTISPVVIVAVTHGEKLLVTRYKGRPSRRYALVAGYGEIGESLEDTVHREVLEETGVHVRNLRYYKSQPWAFSSTILSGFFCELEGDPAITLDEQELSEAIWLHRDEIPPADSDFALTSEMMEVFRKGEV